MILHEHGSGIWEQSKPRASGDDPATMRHATDRRLVNPARAGMIRGRTVARVTHTCKPRASGDDPSTDPPGFPGTA